MAILAKDVSESIRRNARTFQAIIDIGTFLEEIGSLDGALEESRKRVDASIALEQKLADQVSGLKSDISALTGKKADHLVRAEELISMAEGKAAGILAEARVKASEALSQATAQAGLIISDAEFAARGVSDKMLSARNELVGLEGEIGNASRELDSLRKAIDELKTKFN